MARSHAKILASIWADPDFVSLSAPAQRMYMLLLSQSKLTLVGVLDYVPQRWATLANGETRADVEAAVRELEDNGFVVIDPETVELCIRSFVRHDIANTVKNSKIRMGFWRHFATVSSPELRRLIASEIPEELWDGGGVEVPADALALRPEPVEEPVDISSGSNHRNEPQDGTTGSIHGSNPQIDPPASCHRPVTPYAPLGGFDAADAIDRAAADAFIHSEDLIA